MFFSATVTCAASDGHAIAVTLQTSDKNPLFTVYGGLLNSDTVRTVSMNGYLLDTFDKNLPYSVSFKLNSESVFVEHAFLTVAEV